MVQIAQSWDKLDWLLTVQVLGPFITAFLAIIALLLNAWATRDNTKTRHLDIFYKVFQNLQDLQDKYYRDYSHLPREKQEDWLSVFYNALECVAFLIREKQIKEPFLRFYKKAFITSYEDIFWKHGEKYKTNPESFKEMKALYRELTGNLEPTIPQQH